MRAGERVEVVVLGEWRPATVREYPSQLGNYVVELDEALELPGLALPVRQLVRAPADVRPMLEFVPTLADRSIEVEMTLTPEGERWRDGLFAERPPADGPFDSVGTFVVLALALLAFFLLTLWLLT